MIYMLLKNTTNLAKYIHPTKNHVCKSCGLEHSIFYVYPTENTWKWLNKNFNVNKNNMNKSHTIFQLFENIEITSKHNDFMKYFSNYKAWISNVHPTGTFSLVNIAPLEMSSMDFT